MKVDAIRFRKHSFEDVELINSVIPAMMKQPDWIGRIPQIRAELSCVTTRFIDRRQLERLFGVSASQGRCLITRMGPMLHGNSLVVDAEDILKMLSDIERDQEVHDLRLRLTEKSAELEQARQNSKAAGLGTVRRRVR
jgi:hypothetical protein